MNIGVNARFLYSDILEGIGRYTWETTKRMILDHPEDHFYLFFDRPFHSQYIIADNVTPVVLSPPARHPILFYIWFEIQLPKAMDKFKIDVFYSPDNFMSLTAKIPTLLIIHDLAYLHYPQHFKKSHLLFYRYFTPRYVKKARHIITVSEFVKNDVIQQFNLSPQKITVGYNSLPERAVNINDAIPLDRNYFVFVGSLNPRKNIHHLIEAFKIALIRNKDIALVLIGSPYNLDAETKDLIATGIKQGNIIHLEGIKDEKLMNWISHAKAMVYPSLFEGFGIPVIEAMSLGTPVITSNVSSMPEVSGDAAILVDPNNVDQISQAMISILTDTKLVQRLQTDGLERAKCFSWNSTAEIIYKNLVSIIN